MNLVEYRPLLPSRRTADSFAYVNVDQTVNEAVLDWPLKRPRCRSLRRDSPVCEVAFVLKVHRACTCTYPGRVAVSAVHGVHAEGRVAMASRRRCLGNEMLFHYSQKA